MKINNAILAENEPLQPIEPGVFYEYVVAGNGLFIRAERSQFSVMVPIASVKLRGLYDVTSAVELKVERVPGVWLRSVLDSARRAMPCERMYQFHCNGDLHMWRCSTPEQSATPTSVKFKDDGESVIDLHSHNSMPAFFSDTDDGDEQGFRFYCVIGRIDTETPQIRCRVGVYGHHMDVPALDIFDDLGPFTDLYGKEDFTHPEISIDINVNLDPGEDPVRTCR